MGDNGNLGDAVTQTSTWYFLNQMFIFISCIIMNIAMFNCDLNIHTCTWIVSLTIILKYLLNYGIKICQNVAYLLTEPPSSSRETMTQPSAAVGGVFCVNVPVRRREKIPLYVPSSP
jgi:hypothetical protein